MPLKNCTKCAFFTREGAWHCTRNSIVELRARGLPIEDGTVPNPEQLVCDDWEEPP